MGKFKNKLYRFMYGRYGTDTLNKFYLGLYVAIVLVFTVCSWFIADPRISALIYLIYAVISFCLIILIFFRMFSRNLVKRRRENEAFCGFFKLRRNRFRDRKTHVYRKCPSCQAVLRLPKSKGMHTVVCPRCKNRFGVKG